MEGILVQNAWQTRLKHNPLPELMESGSQAIRYFTQRDLLEQPVPPLDTIWRLEEAQRILRRQQPDGAWTPPGNKLTVYPPHHYRLVETWKRFRTLVENYEFTRENPACRAAAEYIMGCQSTEGDIRGMIGNQYATYYTGAMLAHLIQAGYSEDPRVHKGLTWLLSMRQDDGAWTIPILTYNFNRQTMLALTSTNMAPVKPDRSKPFSHNWTDMVLRAFAVHPQYQQNHAVRTAAERLKSSFFKPDVYPSYHDARYWVRFLFWWPNLLTALRSLSSLGYSVGDPTIDQAVAWFVANQQSDGLWGLSYPVSQKDATKKSQEDRRWLSLAICRVLKQLHASNIAL